MPVADRSPIKLLMAVPLFALAASPGPLPAALAALSGMVLLAWWHWSGGNPDPPQRRDLVAVGGALLAISVLGRRFPLIGPFVPAAWYLTWGAWAGLLAVAALVRDAKAATRVAVVAALLALVSGSFTIYSARGVGYDVLLLHGEAANALAAGVNPYSDAVSVPHGNLYADPDATIDGYTYPPVALVSYALGEWLGGDPRWTGMAAFLAALVALAIVLRRRPPTAVLIIVLFALNPAWPWVLEAGWTEVISLLLVLLAASFWFRPLLWAVFLGLALASKQYFLVLTPLLLLIPDRRRRRYAWLALAVAAATLVPFLVWDFGAFWRSAVEFHIDTPARPGSANLVGLLIDSGWEWRPPIWLVIGAPAGVAAWVGRRATSPSRLVLGVALSLSIFFFLANQAAPNYWFLISGLLIAGIGFVEEPRKASDADPNVAPSRVSG